jgi:AraC-like DNA-binding protein
VTMDVLTDVLNALRLKSTLYCRSEMSAPYSLRFEPVNIAVFHVLDRGGGWLHLDDGTPPIPLASGDVVVLPRGTGHIISDDPHRPPIISIWLDREVPVECQVLRYTKEAEQFSILLCGTFDFERGNSHPLITLLPNLLHLKGEDERITGSLATTLHLMAKEAGSNRPGSQTLLRRLADILFVQVVRSWLEGENEPKQGWLGALKDDQIGKALGLIHHQPAEDWTVANLATQVAMSRSAFAARFTPFAVFNPLAHAISGRYAR